MEVAGALFREYPGPWQCMVRGEDGKYRHVAKDTERYSINQVIE